MIVLLIIFACLGLSFCKGNEGVSEGEKETKRYITAAVTADKRAGEDKVQKAGGRVKGGLQSAVSESGVSGGAIDANISPEQTKNLYGQLLWNVTNIYLRPDFNSPRIGTLRKGTVVLLGQRVKGKGSGKCFHGWYSLVDGRGFICADRGFQISTVLIESDGDVNPPTLEEVLPYRYGRVMVEMSPLYARLPTKEEQQQVLQWASEQKKKMELEEEPGLEEVGSDGMKDKVDESADSSADSEAEGFQPVQQNEPDKLNPPQEQNNPEEQSEQSAMDEPAQPDENQPSIPFSFVRAFLKRGFYISIDKEVVWKGERWYRTTRGGYIRYERVFAVNPSPYRGYQIEPEVGLPVGLVIRKSIFGRKWNQYRTHIIKDRETVYRKFFGFHIYKQVVDRNKVYYQIEPEGEKFILSWSVVVLRRAISPPPEVPEGAKWIHVDISDQLLTAYEGRRPVFVTFVSTGNEKKDEEFATPRGLFNIVSKHVTATMANLAVGEDAYSIEDVPWTMYFYKSYALHGAFWHGAFGHMRSHGCVNLAPADARFLFFWTDPPLPLGWHSVYTLKRSQGTYIYITD